MSLNGDSALTMIRDWWAKGVDGSESSGILNQLKEYIRIPNQSPGFDKEVLTNGHQDQAIDLMVNWAKSQSKNIKGMKISIDREEGLTPVIIITIDATDSSNDTVLMYGHMDKQPPMTDGWDEGLGPWSPVIRDGKLYGRGGADDGYAIFASLNSIAVLQSQSIPHSRIVVLIEACEESGSKDLPHYLNKLSSTIGTPSLVVCLDSGCGNYEQLWLTSSLRGMLVVDLSIKLLREGVHSGMASGIVPSTFRILRLLLDRIEDPETGKLPEIFYTQIPEADQKFAQLVAETVGETVVKKFPFLDGAGPLFHPDANHKYSTDELAKYLLKATWEPTISYTGIEGIPPFASAGNVLRTNTGIKLSIRLPPTVDPEPVYKYLEKELSRDSPYGATVNVSYDKGQIGWSAPTLSPWLIESLNGASKTFFNKSFLCQGEGGSIPFMGMLGEKFPGTQFVITGVLGPASNAHGPNEFLHIDMAQKLTGCVAKVVADHSKNATSKK